MLMPSENPMYWIIELNVKYLTNVYTAHHFKVVAHTHTHTSIINDQIYDCCRSLACDDPHKNGSDNDDVDDDNGNNEVKKNKKTCPHLYHAY